MMDRSTDRILTAIIVVTFILNAAAPLAAERYNHTHGLLSADMSAARENPQPAP
jgi:hypothetical protein